MYIEWVDTVPNTQAACEALWAGGYLYTKPDGTNWEKTEMTSSNGFWFSAGGFAFCLPPGAVFTSQLQAGEDYRFVYSARTSQTGGAPTRALRFVSRPPEEIH
jgi:hypothetical protein